MELITLTIRNKQQLHVIRFRTGIRINGIADDKMQIVTEIQGVALKYRDTTGYATVTLVPWSNIIDYNITNLRIDE